MNRGFEAQLHPVVSDEPIQLDRRSLFEWHAYPIITVEEFDVQATGEDEKRDDVEIACDASPVQVGVAPQPHHKVMLCRDQLDSASNRYLYHDFSAGRLSESHYRGWCLQATMDAQEGRLVLVPEILNVWIRSGDLYRLELAAGIMHAMYSGLRLRYASQVAERASTIEPMPPSDVLRSAYGDEFSHYLTCLSDRSTSIRRRVSLEQVVALGMRFGILREADLHTSSAPAQAFISSCWPWKSVELNRRQRRMVRQLDKAQARMPSSALDAIRHAFSRVLFNTSRQVLQPSQAEFLRAESTELARPGPDEYASKRIYVREGLLWQLFNRRCQYSYRVLGDLSARCYDFVFNRRGEVYAWPRRSGRHPHHYSLFMAHLRSRFTDAPSGQKEAPEGTHDVLLAGSMTVFNGQLVALSNASEGYPSSVRHLVRFLAFLRVLGCFQEKDVQVLFDNPRAESGLFAADGQPCEAAYNDTKIEEVGAKGLSASDRRYVWLRARTDTFLREQYPRSSVYQGPFLSRYLQQSARRISRWVDRSSWVARKLEERQKAPREIPEDDAGDGSSSAFVPFASGNGQSGDGEVAPVGCEYRSPNGHDDSCGESREGSGRPQSRRSSRRTAGSTHLGRSAALAPFDEETQEEYGGDSERPRQHFAATATSALKRDKRGDPAERKVTWKEPLTQSDIGLQGQAKPVQRPQLEVTTLSGSAHPRVVQDVPDEFMELVITPDGTLIIRDVRDGTVLLRDDPRDRGEYVDTSRQDDKAADEAGQPQPRSPNP